MSFADAVMKGYMLREKMKQRDAEEKSGNALMQALSKNFEQRNQAAIAPAQQNVKNVADTSLATAIDAAFGGGNAKFLEEGNIDLLNRPSVKNAAGSTSTVKSMSFNVDGKEVLVPTVSDDGRIMSPQEAIAQYMQTGKHLGKFATPQDATQYAGDLHDKQAAILAGRNNLGLARAAQTDFDNVKNVYTNPLEGLKGISGSEVHRILPAVLQMDQNKITQYKSDRNERRAATAISNFQNASSPEEKKKWALEYQFVTGKNIDKSLYTPQTPAHVAPGSMVQDPSTGEWKQIGTPAKKELSAYEQYKIDNGLVGGRGSGGGGGTGGSGRANSERKSMETMFRWASGYDLVPTGENDFNGKPIMTRKQRDPQLAARIAAELGYVPEGEGAGNQSPTGSGQNIEELKPKVKQAKESGYSDKEIADHLGITDPAIGAQLGLDIGAKEEKPQQEINPELYDARGFM